MAYNSNSGAHGSMSRFGGGSGSGANYTFSRYQSNPGVQGNWNTGGRVSGFGSLAGGISPVGGQPSFGGLKNGNNARPAVPAVPPMVQPAAAPVNWGPLPSELTDWPGRPGAVPGLGPPVNWGPLPSEQTDWPGRPGTVPGSTHYKTPARGAFRGNGYGNDQFGRSLGGLGPANRGQQRGTGGGYGGGGGGGW